LFQSSNDLNALSALEYAVDELGVEEIVVFGITIFTHDELRESNFIFQDTMDAVQ
jgi:hypothetical protein